MFPQTVSGFGYNPEFRAFNNASQSVAATTFTKVLFQMKNYDRTDSFNDSTFTAPLPGTYLFTGGISASMADGQRVLIRLFVNGNVAASVFDFSMGAAAQGSPSFAYTTQLAAGDKVDLYIYYSVAENIDPSEQSTFFSGTKIG